MKLKPSLLCAENMLHRCCHEEDYDKIRGDYDSPLAGYLMGYTVDGRHLVIGYKGGAGNVTRFNEEQVSLTINRHGCQTYRLVRPEELILL